MITVITYAVFTVACGFAPTYETLLVFRALQGLGFGGEWAVGAILVAEYTSARHRGPYARRDPEFLGGRLGTGGDRLHAGLLLRRRRPGLADHVLDRRAAGPARGRLRRQVHDAPAATAAREQDPRRGSFAAIFRSGRDGAPGLLRTTLFASLLSTGVQGGYYTLATWVPTYLKSDRGLSVVGTGGYLTFLDLRRLPRLPDRRPPDRPARPAEQHLAVRAAVGAVHPGVREHPARRQHPAAGARFPLGFCMSAIFSGFGPT